MSKYHVSTQHVKTTYVNDKNNTRETVTNAISSHMFCFHS